MTREEQKSLSGESRFDNDSRQNVIRVVQHSQYPNWDVPQCDPYPVIVRFGTQDGSDKLSKKRNTYRKRVQKDVKVCAKQPSSYIM